MVTIASDDSTRSSKNKSNSLFRERAGCFDVGQVLHTIPSRRTVVEKSWLSSLLMTNNTAEQALLVSEVLIHRFGRLSRILTSSHDELVSIPLVGQKNASIIKEAYLVVLDAVHFPSCPTLDRLESFVNIALWAIGDSPVENVLLIYLNTKQKITGSEIVCRGSESLVAVDARVIVAAALRKNARWLVLAHNHPGGCVDPSDQDLLLTRHICLAASFMGIKVLDHLIVSEDQWFSFKRAGHV